MLFRSTFGRVSLPICLHGQAHDVQVEVVEQSLFPLLLGLDFLLQRRLVIVPQSNLLVSQVELTSQSLRGIPIKVNVPVEDQKFLCTICTSGTHVIEGDIPTVTCPLTSVPNTMSESYDFREAYNYTSFSTTAAKADHVMDEEQRLALILEAIGYDNLSLSSEEKIRFRSLIKTYQLRFALSFEELESVSLVKAVIDTGNAVAIRSQAFRTGEKERKIIEEELQSMIKIGRAHV